MVLENPDDSLPDGAPTWVTPSLVADTILCVRESTGQELTPAEAVEFVVAFSQLTDLLRPESNDKEVST